MIDAKIEHKELSFFYTAQINWKVCIQSVRNLRFLVVFM